jgi:hypothetical protein
MLCVLLLVRCWWLRFKFKWIERQQQKKVLNKSFNQIKFLWQFEAVAPWKRKKQLYQIKGSVFFFRSLQLFSSLRLLFFVWLFGSSLCFLFSPCDILYEVLFRFCDNCLCFFFSLRQHPIAIAHFYANDSSKKQKTKKIKPRAISHRIDVWFWCYCALC